VADSDPNVVYVATGSDGIRSNVIIGKGVYKSTDAGKTWVHLGLEKTGNSGAVLIHPDNPDLVYVAAMGNPFAPNSERGVYRSKDGGQTWENVLFVSDKTGAVDLEFAPDNPATVYASMWRAERKPWTIISGGMEGGVYRSKDGGDTWDHLTSGLPNGLRGKSDLAVSMPIPRIPIFYGPWLVVSQNQQMPERPGGLSPLLMETTTTCGSIPTILTFSFNPMTEEPT
jgi:hypothetical protein